MLGEILLGGAELFCRALGVAYSGSDGDTAYMVLEDGCAC